MMINRWVERYPIGFEGSTTVAGFGNSLARIGNSSAKQLKSAFEETRGGKRNILPSGIRTLAPPMQHQVESRYHAEAITGKCPKPSYVRIRDRKRCKLPIDHGDEPPSVVKAVRPLKVAVNASDTRLSRKGRAQALAQFRCASRD